MEDTEFNQFFENARKSVAAPDTEEESKVEIISPSKVCAEEQKRTERRNDIIARAQNF